MRKMVLGGLLLLSLFVLMLPAYAQDESDLGARDYSYPESIVVDVNLENGHIIRIEVASQAFDDITVRNLYEYAQDAITIGGEYITIYEVGRSGQSSLEK